ncbi:MAG: reverse transcriptase domain-containing protein [Sweet potato little leaf phytoplasma]|nr:reverse transcriptase domain-containing protein [Sweet potato little leaf phytoplasma]
MLLAGKKRDDLNRVKSWLKREFDMKDLGESKRILGVEIIRNRRDSSLMISQVAYSVKMLKRFKHSDAKHVSTPLAHHFKLSAMNSPKEDDEEHQAFMSKIPYAQAVGSLMYLMVSTRPIIINPLN